MLSSAATQIGSTVTDDDAPNRPPRFQDVLPLLYDHLNLFGRRYLKEMERWEDKKAFRAW